MIPGSFYVINDLDKRRREYRGAGWLYVAHNKSFKEEEAFKIGQSKRPPSVRVNELGDSTVR